MKLGIFINARSGSTRLSNKHFQDLGGGPALAILLGRISNEFQNEIISKSVRVVIVSGNQLANGMFDLFKSNFNLDVFYGNDENVPFRQSQAASFYNVDAILSVDGDDLFCSTEAMRSVFNRLKSGADFIRSIGLPLGMNCWGYSTKTLKDALENTDAKKIETGWGRIFEGVLAIEIDFPCHPEANRIRATLDYREDLSFFEECLVSIPNCFSENSKLIIEQILNKKLFLINECVTAKYWENFHKGVENEKTHNLKPEKSYSQRLHAVIPGGAHTYSRGDDQYPSIAPQILERGKGCSVWSPDGRQFIDYGMALRSVSIGYAEPDICAAAISGIQNGNSLTRASMIELEAAERLVSLIDSIDMVKFTKNGSTATSAAVKLARAFTGRDLIARCAQHPFFSFDDWFIGSTIIKKGVPTNIIEQTKLFNYNDIQSLEALISDYPEKIACVILEPAATECPGIENDLSGCCMKPVCTRFHKNSRNYLSEVQDLCKKHGIVFILDETITGFRWDKKGAQHVYGVEPDITTFGKAMANGFSVAAVGGKKEIMKLGSIDRSGEERVFLLSTTHGAEMCGLAAFLATMDFIELNPVIDHLWRYGADLVGYINSEATKVGINRFLKVAGPAVNPYYITVDANGNPWQELRTLFSQEMIRHGVLMPWIAICYRHDQEAMCITKYAVSEAVKKCAMAIESGFSSFLSGPVIKPVYRKYN